MLVITGLICVARLRQPADRPVKPMAKRIADLPFFFVIK
jgi:hypothetical protein